MIKHYLKVAFRNLMKYKMQSFVSIIGLAVGFTCFALSALWIRYEMTYDNFHKGSDRIYMVRAHYANEPGTSKFTPYPLMEYLQDKMPEIEAATAFTPHHVHNEHCGCGHQHLPAPEQLQAGDDWRARAAIVLSMGMRPCSGAIMVLLFSKVIGVFGWGMAAALAMAAGTSLTITALALLVHGFRQLAIRLSRHQAPALWKQVSWATLALAGGVILLAAAGVMWLSAVPAGGGIRPF